jgi:hypothetical protein
MNSKLYVIVFLLVDELTRRKRQQEQLKNSENCFPDTVLCRFTRSCMFTPLLY